MIAFACLLVSVAWNLWLFNQVQSGAVLGEAPTPTSSVFNQSTLDALSKVFTDRAAEAARYRDGTYRFVDPSK
jgi:hypothetical protein